MRLEFSRWIESDIEGIVDFAAEYSPGRAVRLARLIREKLRRIAKQPFLYQVRHELGEELRLATVDRYVILFSVEQDVVRIERIIYGGRDLLALLQ